MSNRPAIARLRTRARVTTLLTPTTLGGALDRLDFVQADPIRAPARAQDLILRHRVSAYRAGDLERSFPRLKLEEDFLYAYGFTTREISRLLHPRPDPDGEAGVHAPTGSRRRCWRSFEHVAPRTLPTWRSASVASAPQTGRVASPRRPREPLRTCIITGCCG